MLIFKISDDDTPPAVYIDTLCDVCCCRPPRHDVDCNVCVTSVGELCESQYLKSHGSVRYSLSDVQVGTVCTTRVVY